MAMRPVNRLIPIKRRGLVLTSLHYGLQVLLLLSSIIFTCEGYNVFLPLSAIKVTIPQNERALRLLSNVPLGKFEVVSPKQKIVPTDFSYQIDDLQNFLEINSRSGEVFLGRNFQELSKPKVIIITAQNVRYPTDMAHMTIKLTPTKETNFCTKLEKMCFWDEAAYAVVEDSSRMRFKPSRIGELGPQGFKHLCPQYDITYRLKRYNSSQSVSPENYVTVQDNVLFTNGYIDHDTLKPGPNLDVIIECLVKKHPNNLPPEIISKNISITVLDRNDNGPKYQEKENDKLIFYLDDPHVIKDQSIGKKIIFLDNDTLTVNSRLLHEIHNDTFKLLTADCNGYETDHNKGLKSSVISCQLKFSRSGILRKTPYCIVLEMVDVTVDSMDNNSVKVNICIETDLEKIHEVDRPTAMALQSSPSNSKRSRNGREQYKGSRRLVNSEDSLTSNDSGSHLPVTISYPRDVYVYRTAMNLSRVTEPYKMRNLLSKPGIKFNIIEDPTRSFGITELAGIMYVKNVTALKWAPETIYYITISWGTGNTDVIIHLEDDRPPNTKCTELDEIAPHTSCSEVGTKKDCQSLCALGTGGGNCVWRGGNLMGLTVDYPTCSPNLTYCPDNICDPLEEIGQKADNFICPQDCSTQTFGPHTTNENKRGIYAASGTCTCDHFGKCSCAMIDSFPSRLRKPGKNRHSSDKKANNQTLISNSTSDTFLSAGLTSFECGPSCLALMIGCPLALIIILISLIISRRKYIRKAKGKSSPEKNDNDNRTNTELPLVSLEAEIKFDLNPDSKWEFPREHLVLDIVLGEGEFGKVVKAYATNIGDRTGTTTVAVKMLKTGANSVEHLALLSEFKLLQEVSHPNVIKLLGACTKGENPLLIIEYALYGSLRSYLRLSRKLECHGDDFTSGVEPVTAKDILSFAWQICKGMAYLTEIKLVHRDLAARNVLLAEGKICKVSDFGLTRDVYEDDAYLKRSKDRVPVKWMAPESLADHVYTTKSDVWAFGILGWELITLGASPYPGIPPQNLYHLLKTGYRMERPENCSEEIYSILRQCWTDDPNSRPSFKYLTSQWEKLLGNNTQYLQLEANAVSNPLYCPDAETQDSTSTDSLIKIKSVYGEPERLEHLWHSPSTCNDTIDQQQSFSNESNSKFSEKLGSNDWQLNIPPAGYDIPRPLIETKTTEQGSIDYKNLRYENDLRFPLNITLRAQSQQLLDDNHYSVPAKRGLSYMDMTNKTLINDNLDNEDIEKKLSKNISFRFSSLLNVNDDHNQQTSIV